MASPSTARSASTCTRRSRKSRRSAHPTPACSQNMWWSLKLRMYARRAVRASGKPPPQIRIFVLYHDPSFTQSVPHSVGMQKGLVGVVHAFADREHDAHQQRRDRARNPAHARRLRQIRSGDARAAVSRSVTRSPNANRCHPQTLDRNDGRPLRHRCADLRDAGHPSTKFSSARPRRSKSAGRTHERGAARNRAVARRGSAPGAHRWIRLRHPRGEFIALLGGNGTGKSLLLRTLAGLRAPAGGSVRLDGRDIHRWPRREIATRLGFLPQDPDAPPQGSLSENVALGRFAHLGFWEMTDASDAQRVAQALADVGLEALAQRELATLSGGEQRRAAIARLLVQAPSIYLLDEPTNHLDPAQQLGDPRAPARAHARGRGGRREPARPESRAAFRGSRLPAVGQRGCGSWSTATRSIPVISAGSTASATSKRAWARSASWRRTSHARSC